MIMTNNIESLSFENLKSLGRKKLKHDKKIHIFLGFIL